jgi:hypothetical protein
MRYVPAQLMAQRLRVVRVHLHVELSARDRDISHAAVEKLAVRLLRVHMDSTRSAVWPWLLWLVTA